MARTRRGVAGVRNNVACLDRPSMTTKARGSVTPAGGELPGRERVGEPLLCTNRAGGEQEGEGTGSSEAHGRDSNAASGAP